MTSFNVNLWPSLCPNYWLLAPCIGWPDCLCISYHPNATKISGRTYDKNLIFGNRYMSNRTGLTQTFDVKFTNRLMKKWTNGRNDKLYIPGQTNNKASPKLTQNWDNKTKCMYSLPGPIMTPWENWTQNLDQLQTSQKLLSLNTEFHIYSIMFGKDITFWRNAFRTKIKHNKI